jgi:muconolactone delta-isomerase
MAQTQNSSELLDRMVAARQLSAVDAAELAQQSNLSLQTEEGVLRWLANEYDLSFTALDDVEPDRQLLSLFPARILLKEELLPLRRVNGSVEVATSRLFATQGSTR